jgi:hypothetical protein
LTSSPKTLPAPPSASRKIFWMNIAVELLQMSVVNRPGVFGAQFV